MADLRDFKRGLDKALPLVKDFLQTPVGRELSNTDGLHICIRDNYINVYKQGCSILRYSPLATDNVFLVHRKYLPSPASNGNADYARLELKDDGSDLTWDEGKRTSFRQDFLKSPNNKLAEYLAKESGEKILLARFLADHMPILLDLEVAFSRRSERSDPPGKPVADRVDMALLDASGAKPVLRLVEYKLASDGRLRSEGRPEVLKQMSHYAEFLTGKNRPHILESYKTVAANYLELGLLNLFPKALGSKAVLEAFIKDGVLDLVPQLLIERNSDASRLTGRVNHLALLEGYFKDEGYAFHPHSLRSKS